MTVKGPELPYVLCFALYKKILSDSWKVSQPYQQDCCLQTFPARSYGLDFLDIMSMIILFCLLANKCLYAQQNFSWTHFHCSRLSGGRAVGEGTYGSHLPSESYDQYLTIRNNFTGLGQFATSGRHHRLKTRRRSSKPLGWLRCLNILEHSQGKRARTPETRDPASTCG